MDRIIKKKKPDNVPDEVIYALKAVLLLLLWWNLAQELPNSFFDVSSKPKKTRNYATPYIEEISYNQLLSTTVPKIDHYMQWNNRKIPFIDPEIPQNTAISYQHFTLDEFKNIWIADFSLHYKGHILNANKVNAIFIDTEGTTAICEDEGDFSSCFYSNLRHFRKDFALWLSIETEEAKTYFTRIRVSNNPNLDFPKVIKTEQFWHKLINRDKHKSIDNLTVVKPVFQTHDYRFKWGNWERYAHGPRGGRRVKLGIQDFQAWTNHQPFLYKDGQFVPFQLSVNFWNRKKWSNSCSINRKQENAPMVASNECFKSMVKNIGVGDVLTIFIFVESDFIKKLSRNTLRSLPYFIVNDQYVQFSIPIEIIEKDFDPHHAPLKLTTSTFGFQLNSSLGTNAIVKMDTENPKNAALLKHYSENETAEIVNISNYKTIRRVITEDDIYIQPEDIEKSYTLTEKVYKVETFPEFYDFNIQPPLIKLRGLSTVLDKTTYNLTEFKASRKGFEFYIGDEKVKLLQATFTVIPKKGKAIQYITNRFDRGDIIRRLRKIKPETSLYFDKILFERANGEQMVFPIATALHLK